MLYAEFGFGYRITLRHVGSHLLERHHGAVVNEALPLEWGEIRQDGGDKVGLEGGQSVEVTCSRVLIRGCQFISVTFRWLDLVGPARTHKTLKSAHLLLNGPRKNLVTSRLSMMLEWNKL